MSSHGIKVLVVDEPNVLAVLVANVLQDLGHSVVVINDGTKAADRARDFNPDVILLDLNSPALRGVNVCEEVRAFSSAHIIAIFNRTENVNELAELIDAADDFMVKPFSISELLARIRAVLNRQPRVEERQSVRRIGNLLVDPETRRVKTNDREVELTQIEFELLSKLSENAGATLSRHQLLEGVWGSGWYGDEHVVDVHISNLRQKLEEDPGSPACVVTVRGAGYRFEADAGGSG